MKLSSAFPAALGKPFVAQCPDMQEAANPLGFSEYGM
jgi:hypothetical protein